MTGASLAEVGHDVTRVGVDTAKIEGLRKGVLPIWEPGLDAIVARNAAEGRLQFTTDLAAAVGHADIQFVAVGTPQDEDGSADLKYVPAPEDRTLPARLAAVAKKNPLVNADAIVVRRVRDRVYLVGNNDQAHYFAVSRLLQDWGCRWYMPTEFGEVVPEHRELSVGALDHAYGSPFEIRGYWLSWLGDNTGREEFQRRNFASTATIPGAGHTLAQYTKNLVAPGRSPLTVPLSELTTAAEVASQVEADYAKGVPGITLGIEDGLYRSDSASDLALQARIVDKYMLAPSQTDAVMTLYNNVGRILRERHPRSPTLIGGLAYANVTIPPQAVTKIEPNVVMWLAPIDIDPNHGMDDPNSPPRQEYKGMMYRWAELLQGRLAIYDYDQGQLVWRDLPNPSHHVFAQDVRHYRAAGILGVNTESRGATATTFLNLFFRLQLLWNPEADVNALLAEFYPKFYGPAAAPMAEYWNAIFAGWRDTLVTEHEYFIAPVIYTPELVARLRTHLAAATAMVAPLKAKASLTRNEKLHVERMRFTELLFAVIENYLAMVQSAGRDADYRAAAAAGERALEAREQLTAMNPTFTTYKKIVSGWPWHLELIPHAREDRIHVGHGGCGWFKGCGVCRSLAQSCRADGGRLGSVPGVDSCALRTCERNARLNR